ncbi:MAG TPA: hypothetical protein VK211_24995 [Kamptonema sp.]|nr:hypothetical protein [Kamptonema sp.]
MVYLPLLGMKLSCPATADRLLRQLAIGLVGFLVLFLVLAKHTPCGLTKATGGG